MGQWAEHQTLEPFGKANFPRLFFYSIKLILSNKINVLDAFSL